MKIEGGKLNLSSPELDMTENWGRPGPKVAAVLLHERSTTSTGKRKITAHMAVVRDLVKPDPKSDPPTDVGMTWRADLWLTEDGVRHVGRFLRAHGLEGTIDIGPCTGDEDDPVAEAASDEALVKVWAQAYVICDMVATERDGKTWREFDTRTVKPYKGEADPAWREIANQAAEDLERRQAERAERRERYGDRGRGGGGGRSRGRHDDGDVPFS